MPKRKQVFICGAVRTPHGGFFGSLKDIPARELGAHVIRALLHDNSVQPETVDGVYMGEVLTAGEGQNPARHAALLGGLPTSCPAETINKVCASSLAALRHAVREIWLGESQLMIAGGMENMSSAPYLLRRSKKHLGNKLPLELFDLGVAHREAYAYDSMLHDGLTEPSLTARPHMGVLADLCSQVHNITRGEQEVFAHVSVARAHLAYQSSNLTIQLVEMMLPKGRSFMRDEVLRRSDLAAMGLLKPAFSESGVVTAATSSQIADGASALLVVGTMGVKQFSLKPMARIVDFATFSGDPRWYTTAPAEAIKILLERNKLVVDDVDLFEINEAFAVVPLYAMKTLAIPDEKVNVWGGAIAIGHPLGATGTRIVGNLVFQLCTLRKKTGIAVACNGGGEAVAVLIERV
ncbi:MAG: thiolase family protein [bacterium]|nr:thiolase family protein [bacterium]